MSDYCTNCKWLTKATNGGKTDWYCTCKAKPNSMIPPLTSLCGNPRRAIICEEQNWYEVKVKQQEKKMTTEEMIKVMQAYVDGKQIEVAKRGEGKSYQPLLHETWDFVNYYYRIKPEPKYRPLKPEELIELVGTVIVDKDGDQYVVGGSKFYDGGVLVFVFQSWINSSYLLKNFKYKDGTPVGKMEE